LVKQVTDKYDTAVRMTRIIAMEQCPFAVYTDAYRTVNINLNKKK